MKLKTQNPFQNIKRKNTLFEEINTERNMNCLKSCNDNMKDDKTSNYKPFLISKKAKKGNEKLSLVEKLPNFTNNFNGNYKFN